MVNNEQFSDISFLVEGRTVHAHKFILFARCEYFRRMFTGGYKESTDPCVPIADVSFDVFLCILTFLYTGTPRPATPRTQPAAPMPRPATPRTQPAAPMPRPATPRTQASRATWRPKWRWR